MFCNVHDSKNNVLFNCMLAVYMAVTVSVVTGNVERVLVIFQVFLTKTRLKMRCLQIADSKNDSKNDSKVIMMLLTK